VYDLKKMPGLVMEYLKWRIANPSQRVEKIRRIEKKCFGLLWIEKISGKYFMATSVRNKNPQAYRGIKKPAGRSQLAEGAGFDSKWAALAGILLLTVIVFSSGISKNFVALDDPAYVRDNSFIKSLSFESLKNIFSSFYNFNYHPVTTLVYAIEYHFFKLNAAPYRIINLLFHLANICLVFVLAEKISGRKEIALLASLFFGIHPLHVESVAWVSELKDVLYSFFLILALVVYANYIKNKSNKLLACTFVLFLLSLLSKPAAVTFPLLLPLFDYYYKRKLTREVILEKVPFFLLSLIFGIITVFAQKQGGAINTEYMVPYSAFQRIFIVSYGVVFYIVKLFVPANLCAFYYAPKVIPYYYYICPLVIVLVAWLVSKSKAMKQQLIFGLLFYVFSIILVIQIIPVGYAIVAERYSYVPYIGLFFIAGSFYTNVRDNKLAFSSKMKPFIHYIFIGLAIVFSVTSFQRSKIWRDSLSLFTDIAEQNPESSYAHNTLGKIQNEATDYAGALASFNRSIELDSSIADVYFNRGNTYNTNKNYAMALRDYLKAFELKPIILRT
jgi:tetratricopeptide (TPR) repeat protein